MNEDSWLICNDTEAMLDFLEGKSSSRKLRLFACACCRRIWPMLADERSRAAVEIAERYADGLAAESEREEAQQDAEAAADEQTGLSLDAGTGPDNAASSAAATAMNCVAPIFTADDPEGSAPFYAASNALLALPKLPRSKAAIERAAQCGLLRDIFGPLPFRSVSVDVGWLTPGVVELARTIYEERAFDRMPEVAEILEQAGCDNADILAHCRQPGEHVRGCWVLDFLLGKA
jgi:hypothetical protein